MNKERSIAERGRIASCFISLHPLVSAIISQPSLTFMRPFWQSRIDDVYDYVGPRCSWEN